MTSGDPKAADGTPTNVVSTRPTEAQVGEAVDSIRDGIARLIPDLLELQARAEALGVFLADRELLQCPDCGLMEDVTAHGILFTYHGEPPGEDTGLRFEEFETEGCFRCPSCGTVIELPGDEDA